MTPAGIEIGAAICAAAGIGGAIWTQALKRRKRQRRAARRKRNIAYERTWNAVFGKKTRRLPYSPDKPTD